MTTVIIDYGSGNLRSVAKALEWVSEKKIIVSSAATDLKDASRIVLPGVGAFADCMQGLGSLPGMLDALFEEVLQKKKNFLGICVGMQMLFERGHEYGVHNGLGWIQGEVTALHTTHSTLKIPHMGWNELTIQREHPLLKNISNGNHAYFVHSYHANCKDISDVIATTEYGQKITAVVARDNVMGTQFHPEKSQTTGLALLKNFVDL